MYCFPTPHIHVIGGIVSGYTSEVLDRILERSDQIRLRSGKTPGSLYRRQCIKILGFFIYLDLMPHPYTNSSHTNPRTKRQKQRHRRSRTPDVVSPVRHEPPNIHPKYYNVLQVSRIPAVYTSLHVYSGPISQKRPYPGVYGIL